ncbi:uncharacterized protein LOC132996238 [Limanda limanda]|uniref:uncharacterized protein LOC132996238 n=1 Tax=Limanda limanda TaxID=27771 RepID=UPI0029C95303|nr:uncharacterized protein LOC132996238 [Limanda limanda]
MVGGRLRCLSCFSTHSELLLHLLLLGVCLHDVEASSCDLTVHKQVGDTVEFSSCVSPGRVDWAEWRFNKSRKTILDDRRFDGRVKMNPANFSLTLMKLTLQDSGDFSFLSEVNDEQVDTVTIRLQVHEPLTPPHLSFNSTFHPSNESCTVSLECVSTPDSNVSYSWSVRNQTLVGSRLWYNIRPEDGETKFTCTISNSESSTSETVTCVNSSSDSNQEKQKIFFFAGLAAGGVLIVGLVIVICVCHCKQRPAVPATLSDTNSSFHVVALVLDPTVHHDEIQLPVYSSLLHGQTSFSY